MLRLLSLYLTITLAVFSGVQGHAGMPMVICSGGSIDVVMVDTDGTPIEHETPCELCCLHPVADLPPLATMPQPVEALGDLRPQAQTTQSARAFAQAGQARAPPLG